MMQFGHVGLTVSDLERSAVFYEQAFGFERTLRITRDEEWIRRVVGYPYAKLEFQHMKLESGMHLELVKYASHSATPFSGETCVPGSVHFCLEVADIGKAALRAKKAGARIQYEPTRIPDGPNSGAYVLYLRDPDDITVELFQRAK